MSFMTRNIVRKTSYIFLLNLKKELESELVVVFLKIDQVNTNSPFKNRQALDKAVFNCVLNRSYKVRSQTGRI